VVIPPVRICFTPERWTLDWRSKDCVPFLHRGMYFDSFDHAMDHDRRCGLPGPIVFVRPEPTREELARAATQGARFDGLASVLT
jgi:hypothetical protein